MTERKYRARIAKKDREISKLKKEVARLKGKAAKNGESAAAGASAARRVLGAKGYFSYLRITLKGTTVYGIFGRVSGAVKKYAALSRAIRGIVAVVTFIQTSAAALVVAGVLAVLVPAALIFYGALFALSLLSYGRLDGKMKKTTGTVYIFAFAKIGDVLAYTAEDLSGRGSVMYLTSSFSVCGFSGARLRRDGSMYIHVSYFFRMRKILKNNGVKLYFIA